MAQPDAWELVGPDVDEAVVRIEGHGLYVTPLQRATWLESSTSRVYLKVPLLRSVSRLQSSSSQQLTRAA
jgi:hypothetical protein